MRRSGRIRLGVVGLGFGAQIHIPGLRTLPDVEVIAIAGRDPTKTEKVAHELGIPIASRGFDELMEQDIDAVTLALPPQENEVACKMALERGLPILSEKPIATSPATALHLAKLAVGTTTMVDFQFAELAGFKRFKEIIDTRRFGHVRHVHVTWLLESWGQSRRSWSWKVDANRHGGVIAMLGSHFLYIAEWLFGPASKIFASTQRRVTESFSPPGAAPAEDLIHLIMDFASGVVLSATIGNATPGGCGHRWEAVFDEATATLYNPGPDYMSGFSLKIKTRKEELCLFSDYHGDDNTDGRLLPFVSLARRFVGAVKEKKIARPDFSDGARVQTLMEAIKVSSLNTAYIPLDT